MKRMFAHMREIKIFVTSNEPSDQAMVCRLRATTISTHFHFIFVLVFFFLSKHPHPKQQQNIVSAGCVTEAFGVLKSGCGR